MAMTYEDGYIPFSFSQPDSVTADVPGNGDVSSENIEEKISSYMPSRNDDSLSALFELAKDNPEYMELYLKLLAERENETSARAWYENMSNTAYQRQVADLQKAGLNPYLALTSLAGAGAGSVQSAGTWNSSPYANKVQKDTLLESMRSNKKSEDLKAASIAMGLVTAIIAAVALLA